MKKSKARKRWGAMTAAELAEETKEFDHPLPASRYKPLSKSERERFERAGRAGLMAAQSISLINVDPKLIDQATRYAKRKQLTLNQVVERGLRRELAVRD